MNCMNATTKTGLCLALLILGGAVPQLQAQTVYDVERPPEDAQAVLGEPGHRWLTAQGPYSGDTATLEIFISSGGVFDSPEPPVPDPVQDGTMKVHFASCEEGTVIYDIPATGVSGAVPIQRIVPDMVPLCEALNSAPE